MGKCAEPVRAEATILGSLERPPVIRWCHAERKSIAEIVVGGLPIVAYGAIAERLNGMRSGSTLRIIADLVVHNWKTGEGKSRQQINIVAKEIENHE